MAAGRHGIALRVLKTPLAGCAGSVCHGDKTFFLERLRWWRHSVEKRLSLCFCSIPDMPSTSSSLKDIIAYDIHVVIFSLEVLCESEPEELNNPSKAYIFPTSKLISSCQKSFAMWEPHISDHQTMHQSSTTSLPHHGRCYFDYSFVAVV